MVVFDAGHPADEELFFRWRIFCKFAGLLTSGGIRHSAAGGKCQRRVGQREMGILFRGLLGRGYAHVQQNIFILIERGFYELARIGRFTGNGENPEKIVFG